ncbi:MAG TPA: large conductance mechanosensitive channel protein MscL [Hanamia sp.]|jgi:large conductance mechanosensitive channel|nr:large conductance mechanosensitive channel protein MscL [Hanamia sp.]
MSFIKDFKDFALKGNVVDLAVAVIIGAAFSTIVSSLVKDIITPLILTPALDAVGAKNIAELKWGEVTYGNFLAAVINFLVISLALFIIIKKIINFQKKEVAPPEAPAPPPLSTTDKLLTEIKEELQKR